MPDGLVSWSSITTLYNTVQDEYTVTLTASVVIHVPRSVHTVSVTRPTRIWHVRGGPLLLPPASGHGTLYGPSERTLMSGLLWKCWKKVVKDHHGNGWLPLAQRLSYCGKSGTC